MRTRVRQASAALVLVILAACRPEAIPGATVRPTLVPPEVSIAAPAPPLTLEDARRTYPPEVTRAVLEGKLAVTDAFGACIATAIGADRASRLRSGAEVISGADNDAAALCLARIGATLAAPATAPTAGPSAPSAGRSFTVERVPSSYARRTPTPIAGARFRTGQDADLLLGGPGFGRTGGPLAFNHPSGIASDGTRLILADTFNNRVLVWNEAPATAKPPDIVLGQKSFDTNDPGTGRDGLNWPFNVATDGRRLIVADTQNDRVLVWNEIPRVSGAAADIVVTSPGRPGPPALAPLRWPWGVWSDGTRLAVASTGSSAVLIWDSFPTRDAEPATRSLTAGGAFGTPRHVTSDGNALVVGDHNARVATGPTGGFVWKSWPASDVAPDLFLPTQPWPRGAIAPDGRAWLLTRSLGVWPLPITGPPDPAAFSLLAPPCDAGDYESLAFAKGRVYVSCGNDDRVVVYDRIPASADARPSFAIGAPDLRTNPLRSAYVVQNGAIATDGRSLFVASDFDRRLSVWTGLPDTDGAKPDLVYDLHDVGPWAIALSGDRLALAGQATLWIWDRLDKVRAGEAPDRIWRGRVGTVQLRDLRGVALDDRYLYLADAQANAVYVFSGLPAEGTAPVATLSVSTPKRMASDGRTLLVTAQGEHSILAYRVDALTAAPARIGGVGRLNLPEGAGFVGAGLAVADTSNHRVLVWHSLERAMAGQWPPDVALGQPDLQQRTAAIGRARLFMPGTVAFDGESLWVAEFKFSNRMVRFRPVP